jgi:hypothetical protein
LGAIVSVPVEELFEVLYSSVEYSFVSRCSCVLPTLVELFFFQSLSVEGGGGSCGGEDGLEGWPIGWYH